MCAVVSILCKSLQDQHQNFTDLHKQLTLRTKYTDNCDYSYVPVINSVLLIVWQNHQNKPPPQKWQTKRDFSHPVEIWETAEGEVMVFQEVALLDSQKRKYRQWKCPSELLKNTCKQTINSDRH